MNENLKVILDSYEKEKAKIRKRIDANKDIINKLNHEHDNILSGFKTFSERVNAYKENKSTLADIEKKLSAAYETKVILNTALKVANEMKVDATGNALKHEIISNPEKWGKYPLHFQKFKDMVKDFLSGTDFYLVNLHGIGGYYVTGCYDYNNITCYVFYTSNGIITKDVVEEMKAKQKSEIIPASDILKECKKAFTARKKILEKYEKTKKEIDVLRHEIKSCSALHSVLPYANSTMENYKRF